MSPGELLWLECGLVSIDISDDLRLLQRSQVKCPSGTVCSARGIVRVVIHQTRFGNQVTTESELDLGFEIKPVYVSMLVVLVLP